MNKGDVLTVTGEDDGSGWVPVTFGNVSGWAKTEWLHIAGQSSPLPFMRPATELPRDGVIISLIDDPDAEFEFEPGVTLLEVYYPTVKSADSCILRWGDTVAMIDSATTLQYVSVIQPVLDYLGITAVDMGFVSHPHDDHIRGYEELIASPIKLKSILLPQSYDSVSLMRHTRTIMTEAGVPIVELCDGQQYTLGEGGPTIDVVQRVGTKSFTENDRSATFIIRWGDRSLLSMSDLGTRAFNALYTDPPAVSMKVDILKYPHHGVNRITRELMAVIDPQLGIFTAHPATAKKGIAILDKYHVPWLSTRNAAHPNPYRLRTDGHIWVIDYLPIETVLE